MNLRSTLLAASILALPVAAHAQNAPVTGIYLGAGAGANFMQEENSTITEGPYSASGKFKFNPGFAGKASVGYGFGNGFRAELEGSYRYNSASGTNTLPLVGAASARGNEQKFGGMVNGLYDFNTLSPSIIPYVGIGVGYMGVQWRDMGAYGPNGAVKFGNQTKGSFAAQAILGAAIPITPALSLTAEYNFLVLPSDRNYSGTGTLTGVPSGGSSPVTITGQGSAKAQTSYNHTLLVGIRYAFGVTPPPVPVAAPAPAPAPARSYLVFFDWDKYNITDRARQIIADAAANSKKVSYTKIETNGYTDTSGSAKYNMGLSVRRAQAVATQLVRDGVPKNAIAITGFGETNPLVPTGPNVREPQNRRVEIVIK